MLPLFSGVREDFGPYDDGHDTIGWAASLPGSDGSVGMHGPDGVNGYVEPGGGRRAGEDLQPEASAYGDGTPRSLQIFRAKTLAISV